MNIVFNNYTINATPTINKCVDSTLIDNPFVFMYYDKDGFELCEAEKQYYMTNNVPLYQCLNHLCSQQPWFTIDAPKNLIVDHSIILHRCSYNEDAYDQLVSLETKYPQANLIKRTKQKWGFDFAIDCKADNGEIYEVIHIEYDSYNHDEFVNFLDKVQTQILSIDWVEAAKLIYSTKTQWEHLKGFSQNNWKAKKLLDWNFAEYTLKAT